MSFFLLFLGKIFQQLNLECYRLKLLAGTKITKFLMRTFTCHSTFLYAESLPPYEVLYLTQYLPLPNRKKKGEERVKGGSCSCWVSRGRVDGACVKQGLKEKPAHGPFVKFSSSLLPSRQLDLASVYPDKRRKERVRDR
jgi:hypothetical protein